MKNDELSTIFNKTQDYFSFIKSNLLEKSVLLSIEDSEVLEKIDSYLKVLETESNNWSNLKVSEHNDILSKCFKCLQHMDRIANDYKLFQNSNPR